MRKARSYPLALVLILVIGCGTTRTTNTARTGTEQLLLSEAWDHAINAIDFKELSGVPVFLDTAGLKDVPDQGYLVSSLRHEMLMDGALIKTKAEDAQWIVEPRVGAYGTDDSQFMIGVPQTTIPQVVPGVPGGTIPEMPVVKNSKQKGTAKLAIFAYDQKSGRVVWTSGTSQSTSDAKDLYVGGLGPIQRGSIRRGTEFMDVKIPGSTDRPSSQEIKPQPTKVLPPNATPNFEPVPSRPDKG